MAARLQWIRKRPARWAHWGALRGGLEGHAAVQATYPEAHCHVVETHVVVQNRVQQALAVPWWRPGRWRGAQPRFDPPGAAAVDMVWANMQLHAEADPQARVRQWHSVLAEDGFLLFSTLGPDSLRELRALYRRANWPPPAQDFADMHDVGDLLVQAGFSDPVMDTERIVLSFPDPARLLRELRELGRNLHPQRFSGLRGRAWRQVLDTALATQASHGPDGALSLTFEVVYGHAVKGGVRAAVQPETAIDLTDMRSMLRRERGKT